MILATCQHHNLKTYTFQSEFCTVYCCLVFLEFHTAPLFLDSSPAGVRNRSPNGAKKWFGQAGTHTLQLEGEVGEEEQLVWRKIAREG